MGVDAQIYVRRDARVRDVADVMGILAGLKPHKSNFPGGWSCKVDGVSIASCTSLPECCSIHLDAGLDEKLIDGEQSHNVLWHWEPSEGMDNYHLMMPSSTAFWIAVGIEVCKFFGGCIGYNDCDDQHIDRHIKGMREINNPEDGKAWDDFQEAKMAVKPLTMEYLKHVDQYASYSMREIA